MDTVSDRNLKRSRVMYVLEAALEYFVSIAVTGSFLATLTKELGLTDSLTGILSAVTSLGCLFQLFSLSIQKTRVKKFVLVLSMINQLLFMFLYVIPLVGFHSKIKAVLFIIVICLAYLIYNIAHPKKTYWLMSLVEDHHRGIFTAHKEMVSLISGMLFSFGMGAVIDHFSNAGNVRIAFILSAVVLFVLMVLHSLTMFFSVEPETPHRQAKDIKQTIKDLVKNKRLLHVTVVFLLYYISNSVSTPFYGTYQINELGLNLKFISGIAICGSISRILVSKFWGNYADKKTFVVMVEKCFIFLVFAQICVIFAVPSTGKIMFVLYHVLHGIAMGGINSSLTNLIFECIPREQGADALAVTHACAGLTGFLTTLSISSLVSYIQNNGNTLFGLHVYAQQVVTMIALIFTVFAILYTRCILIKNIRKTPSP